MNKSQSLFNLNVVVKPSSAAVSGSNSFTLSSKWLKVILPFILSQEVGATDGLNNGTLTAICLGGVFLVGCVSACVAYGARRYCQRTDGTTYQAVGDEENKNPIVEGIETGGKLMVRCAGM